VTVALLPSAEAVMVGWAKAQTDLAAIHGGRVGTRLASTLPAIRLQRIGNSPPEWWQDDASLQVECWAADQATADRLARTFVAALEDIRNMTVTGGKVYTYEITSGPFWSPDDPNLSSNARYILTVDLLVTT
jgi:hypothetical protein